MRMLIAVFLSAALSGLFALGGSAFMLGFVALVPWFCSLDATKTIAGTLVSAYVMSLAFSLAVFAWFGIAIGEYTKMGAATGLSVLLLAAPLFQPQFFVFALVRIAAGRRFNAVLRTLAGASAWVATEWLVPRLLGDTLGYGLYPSRLMRQGADLGGAAGLSFLLILANEAVAMAIACRSQGVRAIAKPLTLAAIIPLALLAYGMAVLSMIPAPSGKPLRMGLIQANIVNYEQQRQEKGTQAVVRTVLDTHFAMSYDAVVRQHADAVLWSETVYPTTFGHPKSEGGAELDREILSIVNSAGVPFVFGTYDRDVAGEYNAAAFVLPSTGLLGFYRKTRLFPLTEYVPAWLEGPTLRRWLPWVGSWRPGNGARVFPLRLADGREVTVLPLICLDDVDVGLAIDGARLGAQAILTMSNDAWFTHYPQGAQLHQAVAAFRSIETRLPQFRVTTNGYSAVIDATGTVLAGANMGEQTLVVGAVSVPTAQRTLMVVWGDWIGLAGVIFLILLGVAAQPAWYSDDTSEAVESRTAITWPVKLYLLPPVARLTAGLLRVFARTSLLFMAAAIVLIDNFQANTLAQIRVFVSVFLTPEAASWCVLFAFAARATIKNSTLVLTRGKWREEIALRDIVAVKSWRLPIPSFGATLLLASGQRWHLSLLLVNPTTFARALAEAGCSLAFEPAPSRGITYLQACLAIRRWRLDFPVVKFVMLPFVLAIPAFYLHQHIAYGSGFGEYTSYGLKAYLMAFGLWWAAWAIGVALSSAVLRALIEIGTLLTVLARPEQAISVRRWLERLGAMALYLGLPSWLLLRLFST